MKAVVLEDESGRFPNTPSFKCQSVLVFYDCGNTGESKLQIGHVNASQVDIATIEKAVACIVNTVFFKNVECSERHDSAPAAGIADCEDFIVFYLVVCFLADCH